MTDMAGRELGEVAKPDADELEKTTVHTTTDPDNSTLNHDADVEAGVVAKAEVDDMSDPNVVDWNGSEDPDNPMNWPENKKWLNILILSLLTIVT